MTHAPTLQRLLTLMCVLLLIVRVAGPHLHLCFDGQEAPASVHFLDVGLHHTASHGAPHRDTDVSLAVDGVSKTGKQISFDDLPIVLLAALLVWILFQTPRRFVLPLLPALIPASPAFLRPPLRRPPQLTSL